MSACYHHRFSRARPPIGRKIGLARAVLMPSAQLAKLTRAHRLRRHILEPHERRQRERRRA
eukprot:scaffold90334_cov66-Phaeocystis_antarctica.AAC.3